MTIPPHDLEIATTKLELDESDADTLFDTDEAQTPSRFTSWNPKAVCDRLASMLKGAFPFLSHLGLIVLIVVGHLIALALVAGWTSLWFQGLRSIGSDKGNASSVPPPPAPGQADDQPSWFDSLFVTVSVSVWTVMAFLAFLLGMWGCLAMVVSMCYFLAPYLMMIADPLAHHISRLKPWYAEVVEPLLIARWSPSSYAPLPDQAPTDGGLDDLQTMEGLTLGNGLFKKVSALSQAIVFLLKNPGPRTQAFYDSVIYTFKVILYIVAHAAGLFPPFAWTTIWSYGLIKAWQGGFTEMGFFMGIFVVAFLLVWSAGALGAIGIGFYGCYLVLSSFIAPLVGRESGIFNQLGRY